MTTAPKTLIDLQAKLSKNLHTVNLGIVGDATHVRNGGYHIGAASLRKAGMSNDYSLEFSADRNAKHDYACAIDIGGSPALLMKLGNRLIHALKDHDPRVYGKIRAVNAPWGGISIDRRFDMESPTTSRDDNVQSNSDRNHIHIEFYRTMVLKSATTDGLYEVLAGIGEDHTPPPPVPVPASHKIYQAAPVPALIRAGSGQYLGLLTGPKQSHGGATLEEQRIIKILQRRLIGCGFVTGVHDTSSSWADGKFGPSTEAAVTKFQKAHMPKTRYFGQVWYDDWTRLFNL